MATAAQAKFSLYNTILEEQEKRRVEHEDYVEQETKRANRAGLGSLLGTILGVALAPMTGGASLSLALMAGAGSRIGSEIGEQTVPEMDKLDEKDYKFGITGEGGIRQQTADREALRKEFNQGQWAQAGQSALTGMMSGGGGIEGMLSSLFAKQGKNEIEKKYNLNA